MALAKGDKKWEDIVLMLKAGKTVDYIRRTVHASNETIIHIRKTEGIPANSRGTRSNKVDLTGIGGCKMLIDQGWKCGMCSCPLGDDVKYVPRPGGTEALFAACVPCWTVCDILRWNPVAINNLHAYFENTRGEADDYHCTGGKYKDEDGPDVLENTVGPYILLPNQAKSYVPWKHVWFPGDYRPPRNQREKPPLPEKKKSDLPSTEKLSIVSETEQQPPETPAEQEIEDV